MLSLLGCERIPYSIMESTGKEGGCGRKRSERLGQMKREHSIMIKIKGNCSVVLNYQSPTLWIRQIPIIKKKKTTMGIKEQKGKGT